MAGNGAASGAGVAHRDLKPDNIMLTGGLASTSSECLMVDLGLVTALDDAGSSNQYTATQAFATFDPPEMAMQTTGSSGVARRRFGFEGDAYALGLTLHEILARRRVFVRPGAPPEAVRRRTRWELHEARATSVLLDVDESIAHFAAGAGWPLDVPDKAKRVVEGLLERDPAARLQRSRAAELMEVTLERTRADATHSGGTLAAAHNPFVRILRFIFKSALTFPTMLAAWNGLLVSRLSRLSRLRWQCSRWPCLPRSPTNRAETAGACRGRRARQ